MNPRGREKTTPSAVYATGRLLYPDPGSSLHDRREVVLPIDEALALLRSKELGRVTARAEIVGLLTVPRKRALSSLDDDFFRKRVARFVEREAARAAGVIGVVLSLHPDRYGKGLKFDVTIEGVGYREAETDDLVTASGL